jgi:hypothetical protein
VDLGSRRHDSSVELVLDRLQLEVSDQHPRQQPAEQQAHGYDAGGGGQETQAESQLALSSNRYPTPQTVWMLGSVMLAAASFSRTCWTCTSTVLVYPGKS